MKTTYMTIAILAGSLIFGYGILNNTVSNNKEAVEKHEEDIVDIKLIDMRQSVLLEKLEAKF